MGQVGEKDFWDKLQSAGGVLTAFAVALIGFVSSSFLERQQASETNARLYTELMSRREEAESTLRKDMLMSIVSSFLQPQSESLDTMLLKLELLAYNFHESLNFQPLFLHLQRQIPPDSREYARRLNRVASDIARKQLLVLEGVGKQHPYSVSFQALDASPSGALDFPRASLELAGKTRMFALSVLDVRPKTQEIKVRLSIETPGQPTHEVSEFSVGFFDFPMIDNVRLSEDQRYAIVLNDFGEESAGLTLLYFPGEYASLKERPYLDDVLKKLQESTIQRGS